MAALQYKDDHNRIAYLGRERGSEDFTDILSYLDHSPLRYALTHDPSVVFDSLVKQFWATAIVRPNTARSRDLVATIDGPSDDSSSPSPVSTDHIPIDVLFEPTSGGINEFFLDSDEDEQIGMSRVAADPDSDDEVLAEILFRGQYISGAGVVVVDKLPDDEIVDPRVKVETVSDYASSPPRSRRKHRGVRSDDSLWDKPVEDFFSSESESDDDIEDYIPPIPYGAFKDWEIVRCPLSNTYYHVYYQENRRQKSFFYLKQLLPHVYREDLLLLRRRMNRYFRLNPDVDVGLDLWRDVNLLCQSLHSDDVEDFWRTQDEWVVSSWKLYPKSSVHVLDLTNGKTVYMFVDKVYPIRATLLERMLRHRLTVPPSYCRDVVVAGNVIQTVQAGLRESYECLASVPIACTARQMVFSSPWLTAKKESGSPLQTALVLRVEMVSVDMDIHLSVGQRTGLSRVNGNGNENSNPFTFFNDSTLTGSYTPGLLQDWELCSIMLLLAFGAAVLVAFCCNVPAGSSCDIPADYVSAGHVLVSEQRIEYILTNQFSYVCDRGNHRGGVRKETLGRLGLPLEITEYVGDEKEEYPFVNKYPSFQEEPIMLVEEESCHVYDTDIKDVIEEEEEFVGKEGFGREEDNIENIVVVVNDL
ncbi:hypothetical protein Tco_0944510 [Tanacetum coccineum]